MKISLLFTLTIASVQCLTLPLSQDNVTKILGELEDILVTAVYSKYLIDDNIDTLPLATNSYNITESNEIYKKGRFVAAMAKTSNCRLSLDKFDCSICKETLPDGKVVRAIETYPYDTTGHIVVSEKNKAIYVIFRGAQSTTNKLTYTSDRSLRDHPFIPGVKVHGGLLGILFDIRDIVYNTLSDQVKLHPDFNIEMIGHSVGAGIASLLTVDVFQRFPQKRKQIFGYTLGKPRVGDKAYARYVAEQGILLKRYVNGIDEFPHENYVKDGYEHEGDEYWHKSEKPFQFVVCPGPYEVRNCSTGTILKDIKHHQSYFGVKQDCTIEESLLRHPF